MAVMWPSILLVVLVAALFAAERRFADTINSLEEGVVSVLLAAITIISFTQVVARYGFNTGWGGALELTRILFAWLILFGMSWGVKHGMHLGVDALIRTLPKPLFRAAAIFGALCCLLYAMMLLHAGWLHFFGAKEIVNYRQSGALGYWTLMYNTGIGLDDLRYPGWMQETFGLQERVQRWVAYLMLPIGLALLAFRSLQALVSIWRGDRELIIAGHEAEDLVAENRDVLKD
ncbi:TRAP transporter small permease [Oricola thermophila]|uniref:TRAP transporter small permease protein n=1 Tax=Oricola thermophila TaxID=2742145 RepID=A0A6N1VLM6_9HYPH|nr:TRAP transporter small permease [Oricola thermophila]QKV20332.1 TRAP transporter small permease [Oricola thermophila]